MPKHRPASSQSKCVHFDADTPLLLENGARLAPFDIAYQDYGTLNKSKSNAILVCHALTPHPITQKPGWWANLVGPGKVIDTNKYYVICVNVIGGCMGSSGPASINPMTAKPYGLDFPVVTIGDMVRAQAMLLDYLGIEKLFCAIGGSMGGMQVLAFAAAYKDRLDAAIVLAAGARHSAQNIAFDEIGRQAVMADPDWHEGNYYEKGTIPRKGLAVARMTAHVTYLSEAALHRKFGRSLQDRTSISYGFDADFQIESYLRHQGSTFVERFDANSYLYLTRAMDYFDLAAEHDGQLARAFAGIRARFFIASFSSDWLFTTAQSRELVHALNAAGARVSFVEIETDKGHDAFLLDEPTMFSAINGFLGACAREHGLTIKE